MLVLRLGMVAVSWQASGRVYAEILPGLDLLPEGSRLAVAYTGEDIHAEATPLVHLPVLAIAMREAFVPSLFTYADAATGGVHAGLSPAGGRPVGRQAVVAFRHGRRAARRTGCASARPMRLHRLFRPAGFRSRPIKAGLEPVFVSPRFQIYRLVHGGAKP